jgi:hypothetical protein
VSSVRGTMVNACPVGAHVIVLCLHSALQHLRSSRTVNASTTLLRKQRCSTMQTRALEDSPPIVRCEIGVVHCRRKNMRQIGKPPSARYNRSGSDSEDSGGGNGRQSYGRRQSRPQQQQRERTPPPPRPPRQVSASRCNL